MLVFLIYWFIIIAGFTILGFTADRLTQKLTGTLQNHRKVTPDLWFFAGLIISTAITGWFSVFIPLNTFFAGGYFLIILTIAIIQFRPLSEELRFWLSRLRSLKPPLWLLALYSLALPVLALFMSAKGIDVYDTGLYHTQSIEWIQQYAVVPGLGNLHSRFAFNSMAFPLQAIFEFNIDGQLAYPLLGAVLIVLTGRVLYELSNAAIKLNWNRAIFFSFLITAVTAIHTNHFSSPSTDVIGNLCVVYLAVFMVVNPRTYLDKGFESWILIALILLLPTYKLSNAVLIVFLIPVLKHLNAKKILAMGGLAIVIFTPFLIRNYFLSGYLLFPVSSIDIFSPDWKIPKESVELVRKVIRAWAMNPGADAQKVLDMSLTERLPKWFVNYSIIHQFILILNVLSALIWIIAIFLRKRVDLLLLHAAVLLNVVFWFFSAPDMRFAMGILIINAGMLFLYANSLKVSRLISLWIHPMLLVLPLLCWSYLSRFEIKDSLSDSRYWLTPKNDFSSSELIKKTSPFVHYQPTVGDRCYDAPLPCTPENCEQLEMRGQSPEDGYRVKAPQVEN